ncbi:MAG TPA: PEP-CTERM sorting domain-containing protein [Desulfobacteraceae bacterium]|nr:PEP-CTERM sorting domain-containing protein [Desulfobacteraceae bacterium]
MNKYLKSSILMFLAIFFASGSVIAVPFSSTGIVNMNYNNSWDETSLTGTALFQFYIDEDWPRVNRVDLEFENDVFDLSHIASTDFTVLSPDGWTISLYSNTMGYEFSISMAGTSATSSNDPIEIMFDYTLLGADRYNSASGDNWAWDEGQAWSVSYTLLTNSFDVSSGSTAAVPTPEPATILLFGCGLIGLAGFGRKKLMGKS